MDTETIAKDLVAGYLANNALPATPKLTARVAKRLANLYEATRAEVEKTAPKRSWRPAGDKSPV
jgi:predicted transcriptional regulator